VLLDTFSFERRSFGQPVTAAEIIAVLQTVEGVLAVDLRGFAPVHDTVAAPVGETEDAAAATAPVPAFLPAAAARVAADGMIEPAELLIVNPAPPAVVVNRA
jgi:hypothetical protein